MARVTGLGHVGLYVRDLERMVAFYQDVMGMQITKQNWRVGVVFLSADPERVDHEIALMRGRSGAEDPHLIQQISLRVASLDDLRVFHRRLVAEGYRFSRRGTPSQGVIRIVCAFDTTEDDVDELVATATRYAAVNAHPLAH